ncbi:UNVERIFIED_CONTAM: hypothetical protein FKN15_045387 [Acipenser sinensis]
MAVTRRENPGSLKEKMTTNDIMYGICLPIGEQEDRSCKSTSRSKRTLSRGTRTPVPRVQGGMTILGDEIIVISCVALGNWQDRRIEKLPQYCHNTSTTLHLHPKTRQAPHHNWAERDSPD